MSKELSGLRAATGNVIMDAVNQLKLLSAAQDSILVSYSGGKDSRAVLDLCSRIFKNVSCFFMYFLPDLDCDQENLDWARNRYKVKIYQYPHWIFNGIVKDGGYNFAHHSLEKMPEFKRDDIMELARKESGIKLVAHGGKLADSLWRRRTMANEQKKGMQDMVYPIRKWSKYDVLAYLAAQGIPRPRGDGDAGNASGLDLTREAILWLHDKWPTDYKKLERFFPFVGAVVKRREYYGIGDRYDK